MGRAPGERVRPAPLFGMCPTARLPGPCGRDRPAPSFPPSPRPANRGRRAMPEAARLLIGAGRPPGPAGAGPGGTERCGTNTPHETRCCCSGCSGCSCCGWRTARCPIVVPGPAAHHPASRQRAAPPARRPAGRLWPDDEVLKRAATGGSRSGTLRRAGPCCTGRKNREDGAPPSVALARHFSDQCSKMGDEHNTRKPMTSLRTSGCSGRGRPSARGPTSSQDPPRSTRRLQSPPSPQPRPPVLGRAL